MKQFFAIVKDSYREAKDAKVVYVMFVFSFLLILLLFSVSLRPLTMEQVVRGPVNTFNATFGITRSFSQPGMPLPPVLAIENFRQTNDASQPWDGAYEFEFVARYDKESDKAARGGGIAFDVHFVDVMYRSDDFFFLKGVKTKEAGDDPLEYRTRVMIEGTKINDMRAWLHEPYIGFGAYGLPFHCSVRSCVYYVEKWIVHKIGAWCALLVGVVVTSFFVPNMVRKGTLDLFVSKPIHRVQLLLYKYLGGLLFMFIATALTVGGVWFALGVRTGIWAPSFLWVIPGLVFYFAILYAISTCVGYVTRSPILAILVTCVVWAIFYGISVLHSKIEDARDAVEVLENVQPESTNVRQARRAARHVTMDEPAIQVKRRWRQTQLPGVSPVWPRISDVLYTVLPRTSDLDDFTSNFIGRDILTKEEQAYHELQKSAALFDWYEIGVFGSRIQYPMWVETLAFSLGFIALMLGISIWRFVKMDA